jgi:hypothetical protein
MDGDHPREQVVGFRCPEHHGLLSGDELVAIVVHETPGRRQSPHERCGGGDMTSAHPTDAWPMCGACEGARRTMGNAMR